MEQPFQPNENSKTDWWTKEYSYVQLRTQKLESNSNEIIFTNRVVTWPLDPSKSRNSITVHECLFEIANLELSLLRDVNAMEQILKKITKLQKLERKWEYGDTKKNSSCACCEWSTKSGFAHKSFFFRFNKYKIHAAFVWWRNYTIEWHAFGCICISIMSSLLLWSH